VYMWKYACVCWETTLRQSTETTQGGGVQPKPFLKQGFISILLTWDGWVRGQDTWRQDGMQSYSPPSYLVAIA